MYRRYNNGNQVSASYASFLDTYFEHVRNTNAMFRSIQDTMHVNTSTYASTAAPNSRTPLQVPTRDPRHHATTAPSQLERADESEYISGVTFNIPIRDNDPTSIFNLLSAYASTGGAGAGATGGVAASRNVANNNNNNNNNTIGMRYSDIINNHRTYDACPITREPFTNDERILMLQCNHYFSENGLNRWLVSHSTCPICRFNINNTNPTINNINTINNNII